MSWRDGGHDDEDDEPHGLHASESPTALCLSDYHNSVIPTEAGLLQPDLLQKSLKYGDLKVTQRPIGVCYVTFQIAILDYRKN